MPVEQPVIRTLRDPIAAYADRFLLITRSERYLSGSERAPDPRRPALAAALGASRSSAVAGATVPPRNCGPLNVGSKHYIIKADQIRCTTAKTDAKNYLVSRKTPRGFTCRDFTGSKMTFRCSKGIQVFFAIRR